MHRTTILAGALLLMGAGSSLAQEADTTAPAAQAEEAAAPEEQPADHDWEFTLTSTDKAPGASATVMVVEAEGGSDFVLVANGLPVVDSLDEENRDVNAYTVWVVPGKDKIAESELAGVLTVTPEGSGRLEATTELETFGVIVTATPDGAPETIGGVPVLTGIPVQQVAPSEDSAEEVVEEAAEEADEAAEEVEEVAEDAAEAEEEAVEESAEAADEVADEVEEAAPEATPEAPPTP